MTREDGDPEREELLHPEFVAERFDLVCEVLVTPPAETQLDRCSRPAKINLYLLPRDIATNFCKRGIKSSDIL